MEVLCSVLFIPLVLLSMLCSMVLLMSLLLLVSSIPSWCSAPHFLGLGLKRMDLSSYPFLC